MIHDSREAYKALLHQYHFEVIQMLLQIVNSPPAHQLHVLNLVGNGIVEVELSFDVATVVECFWSACEDINCKVDPDRSLIVRLRWGVFFGAHGRNAKVRWTSNVFAEGIVTFGFITRLSCCSKDGGRRELTGVLSVLDSNDHDNLSWVSRRVLPNPVPQLWWQLREESEGVEGRVRVRGRKLWEPPTKELHARHGEPWLSRAVCGTVRLQAECSCEREKRLEVVGRTRREK